MRLAIITDIHEDFEYLKDAFRKIDKLNVDDVVCLGDISGFSLPHYAYRKSRNAHGCLSLLKNNCKIVVLGNHDIHAAKIIPVNCSFFKYPENWYQLDYHKRHELANHILWLHEEDDLNPLYKQSDIEYLRSLPEYFIFETSGLRILFSHYIYPNILGLKKEFYTYKDEFKQHFEFMELQNCTLSFTGHSHINGFSVASPKSFNQYRYKKLEIKPGSACISIPPITRHEKRSGFCIFDTNEMRIEVLKL
jgi:predicted phosphodiesterase